MSRGCQWLMLIVLTTVVISPARGQDSTGRQHAQHMSGAHLKPGDMVRLRVWREPDLSGDFQVDEAGVVVFPRVGSVSVLMISPDSLKRTLINAYSEYLKDPSIDVTLLRRITVGGAVRTPGLYPVDATMTINDVLALAGGPTPEGKHNEVTLIRDGHTIATELNKSARVDESPLQSGDQIYVPERSWLSRNTAIFTAVITAKGLFVATGLTR